MNTLDIMRAGSLLCTVKLSDNSTQTKRIMGENNVVVNFRDTRNILFRINDYCVVFGETYKLRRKPPATKNSDLDYEYSLTFESEGNDLAKAQYLFWDSANELTVGDFSLMGNADTFMDLLLQNVLKTSSGWQKGQVIPTGYKNLTFTKTNCYEALSRLAEEFETEFWIEGKRIHLTKRANDTGHVFKNRRNQGLYSINKQTSNDSDIATRLYAYGAEKNLPADYILTSKRLKLPDDVFPYLEKNVDKYGVVEHTEIFEDIYPRRTGRVTSVNAGDPFVFVDADLDFDINDQLLPGITAKVVFNTGQLAGYQFEVSSYNNSTKTFWLLKNNSERVLDIPSDLLRPAIGDEYVLIDIVMPDSYVEAAELELQERAQALLDTISEPQESFNVTFDSTHLRDNHISLSIGDLIWIVDEALEIQRKIRVTGTVRSLVYEYEYQSVELSDIVSPGTISRIISYQQSSDRSLSGLQTQVLNNSILNNNVIGTLKFTGIPETTDPTGFVPVYLKLADGKLYILV